MHNTHVKLILLYCIQILGPNYPPMTNIRPAEVRSWMKNHRKWADEPIKDLGVFTTAWWAWWSALQPPTRFKTGNCGMMPSTYTMEWGSLRKSGKNGLLLIILTLRWWGVESRASKEWQKAVDDVSSAVFCMVDGGMMEAEISETSRGSTRSVTKGSVSAAKGFNGTSKGSTSTNVAEGMKQKRGTAASPAVLVTKRKCA